MFLVVEGLDGSGKSRLARGLGDLLASRGLDPILLREPGSTPVGERVRALVLDPSLGAIDPATEAFLFSACRAELVRRLIRPALQKGRAVVLDRYFFSTLAYQGGGAGAEVDDLVSLARVATGGLLPDLAFLLDVPPDVAAKRRGRHADRIEARDAAFHSRVRATFLEVAARPEYAPFFRVLDADRPPEAVLAEATAAVLALLDRGAAP